MSKEKATGSGEVSMRPTVKRIQPHKIRLNVGGKFDHFNGTWCTGIHGENILNGGYSYFFAVAGHFNRYKTAILRGLEGIAFSRTYWLSTLDASYTTYCVGHDAEANTEEGRYSRMYRAPWYEFPEDPIEAERFVISDVQETTMELWFAGLRDDAIKKRDVFGGKLKMPTPFLDRDGKLLMAFAPSFRDCDSLSQLRSQTQTEMHEENADKLSSSKNNMYFARGNNAKTHMIDDIPPLVVSSGTYLAVTAQTKTQKSFDGTPLKKIFQYMPQDVALKGVPENMLYLSLDFYLILTSVSLLANDKSGPLWPRGTDSREKGNTDLNLVTLVNLRGKAGPSGMPFTVVASQSQGYLPRLTQWNDIWENAQFGLVGNKLNYALALRPDVKLTRTTVRDIIDNDAKVARALEITSDLMYMEIVTGLCGEHNPYMCTPQELYTGITERGYDWEELLETRSWFTFHNEKHPVKQLTTMDLLKMRAGVYHPYWMKKK